MVREIRLGESTRPKKKRRKLFSGFKKTPQQQTKPAPQVKKQESVAELLRQMKEVAKASIEEVPLLEPKVKNVIQLKLMSLLHKELGERHSVKIVRIEEKDNTLNASVQIDNKLYLFELDKTDFKPIAYKQLTI